MTTIKDIAKLVRVTPSTVARALNDHPHISAGMKAKVRAAAEKLGYVAHAGARAMRSRSSTLVGLITPDIEQTDSGTIAKAIGEICSEAGYQLVLSVSGDDPAKEYDHVRALAGARAAGVVINPTPNPLPRTLALLRRMPVVQLIRHLEALKVDRFLVDDEYGMREAARHLINLGHRRIGYIGGEGTSTAAARLAGYRQALSEAKIGFKPSLVKTLGALATGIAPILRDLYHSARPTALLLGGPVITLRAMEALEDMGIVVPRDLSVVGFGDQPWVKWWGPGLTTVRLPVRDLGLACATFLMRRIREGGDLASSHAVYRPTLIVRRSAAVPSE